VSVSAPAKFFDNYTKIPRLLPASLWYAARGLVFIGALGCAAWLLVAPKTGLTFFWGLVVPSLPALLVIAPGVWRQVCPMALSNQIPRMLNFSRAKDLPPLLKSNAFAIAILLFVGAVLLRASLLNRDATVLAMFLLACLVVPFFGGLIFKGRSGWCGTICPLGPIQRVYGQAPLVVVPNGYCPTCLGCQKTCYDFNPRGAIFSDINDDDPRYAGQRRFFYGLLPGLILGYFLQEQSPSYGLGVHALIIIGACIASAGLFNFLLNFLYVSPYRLANSFGAIALTAFYFFSLPNMLRALGTLGGFTMPDWLAGSAGLLSPLIAALLIMSGSRSEKHYKAVLEKAETPSVDQSRKSLKDRLAANDGSISIEDRETGAVFPAKADQSLLEAMEAAGLKINYGCRSGLCGADPVVITEGEEHLSAPSDDETATLRRLGLEGRARLACVCQTKGPIVVDRDLKAAASRTPSKPKEPAIDKALAANLTHVVIIGNGVAGISTAEALRRESPSAKIDIVTNESFHFYNRMALGRLIYGRAGMDGLHLLPDDWYGNNQVEVWRNTLATAIDREAKLVRLGTGESLPYDKLVLATGGTPTPPDKNYGHYPNAFVLRTAEDAQLIRRYVQTHGSHSAIVIGGGVLGIEAADALHHLGISVSVLHRNGWLMERQLDLEGALKLTSYLQSLGIRVVSNARIKTFDGDKVLTGVTLQSGMELKADLFIACAGIIPNIALAEKSGLAVKRGILVNGSMQTSDPHIYAVGDVAELPGAIGGLWPIAGLHAASAVAHMFGEEKAYQAPRLMVQLKCDGIDLRSFGEIECGDSDRVMTARSNDLAWWRIVLRGDDVIGGVFVGPPGTSKSITKLFQSGGDKERMLKELRAAAQPPKQDAEAV